MAELYVHASCKVPTEYLESNNSDRQMRHVQVKLMSRLRLRDPMRRPLSHTGLVTTGMVPRSIGRDWSDTTHMLVEAGQTEPEVNDKDHKVKVVDIGEHTRQVA